jgi:uncharacterized protein (DUF1501 family)
MHPDPQHTEATPDAGRRRFLLQGGLGLSALALAALEGNADARGRGPQAGAIGVDAAARPHHRPRAKRLIWLHMEGGPSQLDLFEDKPLLERYAGQPIPESLIQGERFAFIKGQPKVLASPYRFQQHGQSGAVLSELLPHTAAIADRLLFVKGLWTEQFNHAPAQVFLQTGHARIGRPTMGSWVSYGLGSLNHNLPTYVVLLSGQYQPSGGAALWSNGFLPSVHQGVRLRSQGEPVLFLEEPRGMSRADRRRSLDALQALNRLRADALGDPEIDTRSAQYELAWRMQTSVPELADLSQESAATLAEYGAEPGANSFANNCLLARRLLERDVRFVQLYHWGWDSHGTSPGDDIVTSLKQRCEETDRACAALVRDLERRGLLEDTLVVWGGEFGRTPMNEERDGSKFFGRDHHPHAFTLWMTGGGLAAGRTVGVTDDFGYHVIEDRLSVHDLHATLLHLLGFDHERLTYRSQGRDFRLTDVFGVPCSKLMA